MDGLDLVVDLHRAGARQGPGGEAATLRAIDLAGIAGPRNAGPRNAGSRNAGPGIAGGSRIRAADVGCGTGAAALVLARRLDADIVAVDLFEPFLAELRRRAADAGLADRIETRAESMDALSFADGSLDLLWSEGAIYNIGFEASAKAWRRFLKPGGVLAVSDLTWLTAERPAPLTDHWRAEYAEVDTASAKLSVLERSGYAPIGYFPLPETCWLDEYYRPLEARFEDFLARHGGSAEARALVEAERREIALYERYAPYVGYGFYVARRLADPAPRT